MSCVDRVDSVMIGPHAIGKENWEISVRSWLATCWSHLVVASCNQKIQGIQNATSKTTCHSHNKSLAMVWFHWHCIVGLYRKQWVVQGHNTNKHNMHHTTTGHNGTMGSASECKACVRKALLGVPFWRHGFGKRPAGKDTPLRGFYTLQVWGVLETCSDMQCQLSAVTGWFWLMVAKFSNIFSLFPEMMHPDEPRHWSWDMVEGCGVVGMVQRRPALATCVGPLGKKSEFKISNPLVLPVSIKHS